MWLIWSIWAPMSSVWKRLIILITHSLTWKFIWHHIFTVESVWLLLITWHPFDANTSTTIMYVGQWQCFRNSKIMLPLLFAILYFIELQDIESIVDFFYKNTSQNTAVTEAGNRSYFAVSFHKSRCVYYPHGCQMSVILKNTDHIISSIGSTACYGMFTR